MQTLSVQAGNRQTSEAERLPDRPVRAVGTDRGLWGLFAFGPGGETGHGTNKTGRKAADGGNHPRHHDIINEPGT